MVEVVVSVMVVSILLVSSVQLVGASRAGTQLSSDSVHANGLAQSLMAEILQQSYSEPGTAPGFGLETGETTASRVGYDDVDDYHNWSASPPQNPDGSQMTGLEGWGRTVIVQWADPSNPSNNVFTESGVKTITVKVTHNGKTVATLTALRSSAGPSNAGPVAAAAMPDGLQFACTALGVAERGCTCTSPSTRETEHAIA